MNNDNNKMNNDNIILIKLLKNNLKHKKNNFNNKKYNTKFFEDAIIPKFSCIIKIENSYINIIKENPIEENSEFSKLMYKNRVYPFINFLKRLNLTNINLVFIFVFQDVVENFNNIYSLPILTSNTTKEQLEKFNYNIFLIPNLYIYYEKLYINNIKDSIDNSLKINKCCFAGSNTNKCRVTFKYCSAFNKLFICNLISNGFTSNIYEDKKHMTIDEQLKYRYILSLDGVVSPWNGLIWKMRSNSYIIRKKSQWYEYWYCLFLDKLDDYFFNINEYPEINNIINNNLNNNSNYYKIINCRKLIDQVINFNMIKLYLENLLKNL